MGRGLTMDVIPGKTVRPQMTKRSNNVCLDRSGKIRT
jgi:hypothetical protein